VALDEPTASVPTWPGDEWEDSAFRGILAQHYVWRISSGRAIENFLYFSHFPGYMKACLGSAIDQSLMGLRS